MNLDVIQTAKMKMIQDNNQGLRILSCHDDRFNRYGCIHKNFDISNFRDLNNSHNEKPGVTYIPSIEEYESLEVTEKIKNTVFGELPIQAGICRGYNTSLNALEYHKSSEIIAAVTSLLLVLGRAEDIRESAYNVSNAEIFFVPEGTIVELFPFVLHFAPLQTVTEEFQAIIILPRKTNLPLDAERSGIHSMEKFLSAKNKWLLAYPESTQAMSGACVALSGKKISIAI